MTAMVTIDFDHAIHEVLASGGQVSFKRRYRLDVVNYSWVQDFVRDRKLRKEIDELRAKITATQKSLIDKDELRAMFEAGAEQVKRDFLEYVRDILSKAQRHECGVIVGFHEYGVIVNKLLLMPLTLISTEELNGLISVLPEGVKREKVEEEVEAIRKQIAEREDTIEKELNPPDRWIYSDTGNPLPYPGGCRWTKFVEGWKKVVARFDGKVDIEGVALKTEAEFKTFYLLEMEKVYKLTPLRKPWE